MNEPNQKPSIEEQYAVALSCGAQSSVVMAAGLQRDRAGVLLLRLRAEYDAVRGELERAGQIVPSRAGDRMALERRVALAISADDDQQTIEELKAALERFENRTEDEIKTASAVILVSLTTLSDARRQLGALALRMAANPKRRQSVNDALQLAGRVLDVWLDDVCHKCDGTGKRGNRYAGEVERECPTCKGSGHRRETIGRDEHCRHFARDLFAEVQRQVAAAAAGIKAAIHADSGPSKPMHPELVRRLAELRGVDAAAD